MKLVLKLILCAAWTVSACSTSKIPVDDLKYIQNHWIHSHEEDLQSVKVYRLSDYDFKPSRGREEIILNEAGNLIYRPISPNDEPVFYNGSWKLEKSNLKLHYENRILRYKIVEFNSNILKLK